MSASSRYAYEDFVVGATIELGSKLVTAKEVIEFASEFDPQPMHLDRVAGEASLLGGLAASGWHTCAMYMRLLCDGLLNRSTAQGSPGLEDVRWKHPVIVDDVLHARCRIISKRLSVSRPGVGLVVVEQEMSNQRGENVLEMRGTVMFATRAALP